MQRDEREDVTRETEAARMAEAAEAVALCILSLEPL